MQTPLRIAMVSAECAPFAKTGGLADVAAALSRTLWKRGHDVRLFVPLYGKVERSGLATEASLEPFGLAFPGWEVPVAIRKAPLPDSENAEGAPLQVEFVRAPALFGREQLYTNDDDEPIRWAGFCRAAIEACQRTGWAPDVFHANDWHTGLLPLLLKTTYAWDDLLRGSSTLLSIHNLGYQGVFAADAVRRIGMDAAREQFHQERLAAGGVNFLETGILHATWLSTVSDTYAREIQTAEDGHGLEGLLARREDHLAGIVNGVDYGEWDPATDPHLPAHYTPDDLSGKRTCRDALLAELGVAPEPSGPVIGIVSRLTHQKGFELIPDLAERLLDHHDVRFVLLGSGDPDQEAYFRWLRDRYPAKVGVHIGYDNGLAHRVEAGSDLFLMPSRYEPCGLNQMYSLKYGTVPLVRSTGGLADTVERFEDDRGTGFVFYEHTSSALEDTLAHALEVWRDQAAWRRMQLRGMEKDFSWDAQVTRYEDLYAAIMGDLLLA
ncbi:MAG: glycogen synthase [Planctomycetota bacterium]|jgi:starch synthase